MDEYEVLLWISGYHERIDDWSERLSNFVAPLYNVHVNKRAQQKEPKDFFDREKINLRRIQAQESTDPDAVKRRRRRQMREFKANPPVVKRKHRKG